MQGDLKILVFVVQEQTDKSDPADVAPLTPLTSPIAWGFGGTCFSIRKANQSGSGGRMKTGGLTYSMQGPMLKQPRTLDESNLLKGLKTFVNTSRPELVISLATACVGKRANQSSFPLDSWHKIADSSDVLHPAWVQSYP